MEWTTILALVIAVVVILFPVAFIWYINGGGIYASIKRRRLAKLLNKTLPNLTCSTNADCPVGYVCLGGRCVPQET